MSRTPDRVFTNSFFRVKIKNVKKNDQIVVGTAHFRVLNIRKNAFGERVLHCANYNGKVTATLILPKDLMVNVSHPETKHLKK